MNRFIIALVVVLLLAAGGYYFVSQNGTPTAPEDGPSPAAYLDMAENALATQGVILLAHADFEKARAAGQGFLEHIDSLSFPQDMEKENSFLSALKEQGINLKEQVDQAVAGFLVTENGNRYALMLRGNFNPAAVKNAFSQAFLIVNHGEEGGDVIFIYKNMKTCGLTPPLQMHVTGKQIIITTPDMMPQLLARLQNAVPAEIDLSAWRSFRKTHFFSIGFMRPRETVSVIPHDGLRDIVRSNLDATVQTVFAGLAPDPNAVGTTAIFETDIHATSAEWARKALDRINLGRTAFRAMIAGKLPTAAELEQNFQASQQENILKLSVPLHAAKMNETKDALHDVGNVVLSKGDAVNAVIDKFLKQREDTVPKRELPQFSENYTRDNLPAFSPANVFIKADAAAGPFGIAVEKAALITQHGRTITELTLKVHSESLKNIPADNLNIDDDASAVATVQISGVYDRMGEDLLAAEDCGTDSNNRETPLAVHSRLEFDNGTSSTHTYLEGRKTLRLIPEAALQDIAKITGRVTLQLPQNIKSVRYAAPLDQQEVKTDNARLYFRDNDEHRLKYTVEGRKNHILAVHALNEQGYVLRNRSSLVSSSAFKNQRNVSRDIQGRIAGAEIIYTDETQPQEFPFEINSFFNHFDADKDDRKAMLMQPENPANFPKYAQLYNNFAEFCGTKTKAIPLPPLQLCLKELKYHGRKRGIETKYSLAAPASPALMGNLTGIEFVIGRYRTPQGSVELLDHQFLTTELVQAGEGLPPYLSAPSISFMTSDPIGGLERQKITGIIGKLVVHMPLKMNRASIRAMNLGGRIEAYDKSIAATITSVSQDRISFLIEGDTSRLVHLVPITAAKKILPLKNVLYHYEDGKTRVTLEPIGGIPEYMELIYATEKQMLQFPFDVRF
ncbi:MAG: hypothetical protein EP349_07150 [Alphaproteobacteria bacterium]|nr:MAG: hypothetical protein EP349_07150 [Alphaproteobacteria bacterium]